MSDPSPAPSSEPAEQASEVQLDSWKEIASYVRRDVSTVQRWEKREGMPVHRHLHDKRGSVYALGSELNAWLESRKDTLPEEETEPAEPPSDEKDETRRKDPPMWHRLAIAGAALLAVLVAGEDQLDQWLMAHPSEVFTRPPEPAVINPSNPYILHPHLGCAAFELPLTPADERWWPGAHRSSRQQRASTGVIDRGGERPDQGRQATSTRLF